MNMHHLNITSTERLIAQYDCLAWTDNPFRPKQTPSEKRADQAKLQELRNELNKRGVRR